MKHRLLLSLILCLSLQTPSISWAAETSLPASPQELLSAGLRQLTDLLEPSASGEAARTFTANWTLTRSIGLPKDAAELSGTVAIQAPDRIQCTLQAGKRRFAVGRNQQELWVHVPEKQFCVVGKRGVPRFRTAPEKLETITMAPLKFPLSKEQLGLLPFLCNVKAGEDTSVGGVMCHVVSASPKAEAAQALKLPTGTLTLWLRTNDSLPISLGWVQSTNVDVRIDFRDATWSEAKPADFWALKAAAGDRIETTALSHMTRAIPVLMAGLANEIPALGAANTGRRWVAAEGKGHLEIIDGTRVIFLEGTPEEMGAQQGSLLKKPIRDLVEKVLYGVGVGSSFEKGRWFFGEIEDAQARLNPFIDPRVLREMDAIAQVAKLDREEMRLANFFPELFHCSGFAVYGNATVGGRLYHGRVLDYLRGVGLEQNAVVMVYKPDQGHAWVNIGYAGFIGSVTAMNEKKISIGEMGGRGEGNWDGKPMAQLVREVMEKASSLEEAIAIMKAGPRTCEYYYVIADGNTRRAVGIAATATTFETIDPGQSHPRLPHAVKDAVLMSAGDRYEALAKRVQEGFGKLDEAGARDLMKKPVCMGSNIHSALFAPETLDFWVANADSKNVASHSRYTHYNLAELLKPLVANQAGKQSPEQQK